MMEGQFILNGVVLRILIVLWKRPVNEENICTKQNEKESIESVSSDHLT